MKGIRGMLEVEIVTLVGIPDFVNQYSILDPDGKKRGLKTVQLFVTDYALTTCSCSHLLFPTDGDTFFFLLFQLNSCTKKVSSCCFQPDTALE